ncbi:MAG TPA: hypothetical protein VGT05_01025 [Patescibacteria group bacterium]|nr:hypothetical protein [Patescibacteria group bacterium]
MKIEKLLLSFFAVLIGLIVAGVAFYFYQTTKVIPPNNVAKTIQMNPSPSPTPVSVYLNVDTPQDESVTANPTITIHGKTMPNATVIINALSEDKVILATSMGDFSTTTTLGDGENQISITSVAPDGSESQKILTVTYSTQDF